ncbi:MAG: hypothetical protein KJ732_07790 [Candidatus Margulisbacteria bacterium]|nr:hypothetical protein [Candidatus Margulisiibacteriota bacterium]
MNTMDNTKLMKAIGKYAFHKYLEKLVSAELHKVTLFPCFSQTGAPNLSEPKHLLLVDDLSKITSLNSGAFNN